MYYNNNKHNIIIYVCTVRTHGRTRILLLLLILLLSSLLYFFKEGKGKKCIPNLCDITHNNINNMCIM